MPNRRCHDGFTLLELTVSIALTAVVFTILFGGLRLIEDARYRGERKLDTMAQDLALLDALQVQVSSAVPRALAMNFEGQQLRLLDFLGSAKEVRFLTRSSWTGGRSVGLWLATYRAVKEPSGRDQLVVSETAISDDRQLVAILQSKEIPKNPTMPVAEAADHIEFLYLRSSSPDKPASWISEWKAEDEKLLPRAIQVHWLRGKQEQLLTLMIPVTEVAR